MELIKLFLLGATGYLLALLYDVAVLYTKPLLQKILYVGFFVTAFPYPLLFVAYDSPHPGYAAWILFPLILVFASLLVYSVLIELALFGGRPGEVYQKGTYGKSRHPGFIWYTVINVLVAIYYWNYHITMLCFGLTLCNLVLITVEDLYFFPRMFSGYEEYRKHTPFFF